jgi:hypothetical protein
MKQRIFPQHIAWSEACMNGDHALAFVAVRSHAAQAQVGFHLVYGEHHFPRLSEAVAAAEDALNKLVRIDENDAPVFSSGAC